MRIDAYIVPPMLFALIGPGVGALMHIILFGIMGANLISLVPVGIIIVGYIIGVVPALLAGIIYVVAWNIRSLLKRLKIRTFGVLLGAMSGFLSIPVIAIATQIMSIPNSLLLSIISLVSGAVCGGFAASTRNEAWDRRTPSGELAYLESTRRFRGIDKSS